VWPEPAADEHAGRLVLFVSDEPLSKARQPAYPLAKAGRADLFKPVPYGTDQRGKPVMLPLMFTEPADRVDPAAGQDGRHAGRAAGRRARSAGRAAHLGAEGHR
jgi:S-DNA-T family DNA segregation ATPase FtsK/SpoIIIE